MRYNILDTAKSSATEARNLFRKHWGDIIRTIEEFLTSSPDATSLAPESASALTSIDQDIEQDGRADDVKQYIKSILKNVNIAEKLRDVIRIECEKLRENGNTIWRKRVLDLMEIFWKQFSNGRNCLKENKTEGHYIIKFVSHIFTMLFEDQFFWTVGSKFKSNLAR
ncbi:unnamed protein product [Rhizophagus irregularis]|uniref:Uncharacterized protein n=1 Tax=Rhizophagus irregularis TaxID=588596 RepID=A0A916EK37_9GLOM|nr:unnamed protein product [Rhizophagus irregularis]CAB5393537.1 unnamed protein product [Rhizophagus irregularis]